MKKGQIVWDSLLPWIIGVIALIVILVLLGKWAGGGSSLIDTFRRFWRFGS